MKTIFRSLSTGALLALVLAMGAVAVSAQDPCTDADGQTKWRDSFTEIFKDKSAAGLKVRIETAKSGLEKYGKCESFSDMTKYINDNIAKWEAAYKKALDDENRKKLISRFNTALTSKNWDDFYASGKELMAMSPDEFRDIELAFASIGFDETYNKNNKKYNDESIRYAKQAIDDLQAGKTFSAKYGVPNDFVYKSKDNALGWMNLIVGYLTQVGKQDKAGARAFLYKATQATTSETAKNPVAYELIGSYYFDELNKVTDEINKILEEKKAKEATMTEDEAKALLARYKEKVAMSNGLAERAIDAFARAQALGQAQAYKDKMKKNVEDAYGVRFGKDKIAGLNAFVAGLTSKPFPDPSSPVAPIADPEPVTTTTTGTGVGAATGTGVGAGNGTGTGAGNGTGMGAANGTGIGNKAAPATTTPVKNTTTTTAPKATTPAKKPGASLKKKTTAKKIV